MTSICNLCESEITKYNLIKHKKSESCIKIHNLLVKKNQEYNNREKFLLDKIKLLEEEVIELKEGNNENLQKQNDEISFQMKNNNGSFNLFSNLTGSNLLLNNIEIIYRREDGYINATKLCQAGEKQFRAWNQNDKTKRFLEVLSSTVRILTVEIIKHEQGRNGERHTWVHPQVAINIAQWISPEFDVQVSKWVYELCITGNVSLDSKITTQELDNMLIEKYEKQTSCVFTF